jgi:hypothetical protein
MANQFYNYRATDRNQSTVSKTGSLLKIAGCRHVSPLTGVKLMAMGGSVHWLGQQCGQVDLPR